MNELTVRVRCERNTFDLHEEDRVIFDGFGYRIKTRPGNPYIPKQNARKLIRLGYFQLDYIDRKGVEVYRMGDGKHA